MIKSNKFTSKIYDFFIGKRKRMAAIDAVFENIVKSEEKELENKGVNTGVDVVDLNSEDWYFDADDFKRPEGFLESPFYVGASQVSMDKIEYEPEAYVIEECLDACKILWAKNIYTYMCSEFTDYNTWILIPIDYLSPENMDVVSSFFGVNVELQTNFIKLVVDGHGDRARAKMIELASQFKIQDVPENGAYVDLKTGLTMAGCSKDIPNPNYVSPSEYNHMLENAESLEEKKDVLFMDSSCFMSTITVFDESKVSSDPKTHFYGTKFIYDEVSGRVYLNRYHYNKHLRYLEVSEIYKKFDELSMKKEV